MFQKHAGGFCSNSESAIEFSVKSVALVTLCGQMLCDLLNPQNIQAK